MTPSQAPSSQLPTKRITDRTRTAVALLERFNKRKVEATDHRIDVCCRKLRDYLHVISQELAQKALSGSTPTGRPLLLAWFTFCVNEDLIDHLIPFVVKLQSLGITWEDASGKLRLQTWRDAMDILGHLVATAHVVYGQYQYPSSMILGCFHLNGEPPGETMRSSSRW